MRKAERGGLPEDLLLWYLSGTLRGEEKRRVEEWLQNAPRAVEEARLWNRVQAVLQEDEAIQPPRRVWTRLMGEIRTVQPQPRSSPAIRWTHVMSSTLVFIILVGLWLMVKPGVVIRWRLAPEGELPNAFRVSRKVVGGGDFRQLGEIPARIGAQQYEYSDVWAIPGREYIYRIEALNAQGTITISESRRLSTWVALPGQLAVLVVSLALGYAATALWEWRQASQGGVIEGGAQ